MAIETKLAEFSPQWEAELKSAAFDYGYDCQKAINRLEAWEISELEFLAEVKRHLKKAAKRIVQATAQANISVAPRRAVRRSDVRLRRAPEHASRRGAGGAGGGVDAEGGVKKLTNCTAMTAMKPIDRLPCINRGAASNVLKPRAVVLRPTTEERAE